MIEITAEIRALIDKAAAGVELAEDECIDLSDGLIHCKKCGGQRQTVVPCFGKSGYFMPRCICQCQREAEEQRKAAEERQRRMERIKRRKAQGLQDRYLYDYTFANDNGQNPLMDKARAYVENWKEAYRNNTGLLLFGDVGTGKSFFAGCIANALLDRDVPVLMTNFPTILNRLTGMFSEDRSEFIASFDEYDLLIIDDLGVERSTEYAMEQMFFVIDSRYRSRRPMIITTNLKLSELKNPPDLAHARIYFYIYDSTITGIGSGIVINNNLLTGKHGWAGELGHIKVSDEKVACTCGANGCLQAMASGPAIINRFKETKTFKEYGMKQNMELKEIELLANHGVKDAVDVFQRAGSYIGNTLANLIILLDVPFIVLGGGVIKVGALILDPIRKAMQDSLKGKREAQIVLSSLNDENGVIGALSLIDKYVNGMNTINLF